MDPEDLFPLLDDALVIAGVVLVLLGVLWGAILVVAGLGLMFFLGKEPQRSEDSREGSDEDAARSRAGPKTPAVSLGVLARSVQDLANRGSASPAWRRRGGHRHDRELVATISARRFGRGPRCRPLTHPFEDLIEGDAQRGPETHRPPRVPERVRTPEVEVDGEDDRACSPPRPDAVDPSPDLDLELS